MNDPGWSLPEAKGHHRDAESAEMSANPTDRSCAPCPQCLGGEITDLAQAQRRTRTQSCQTKPICAGRARDCRLGIADSRRSGKCQTNPISYWATVMKDPKAAGLSRSSESAVNSGQFEVAPALWCQTKPIGPGYALARLSIRGKPASRRNG